MIAVCLSAKLARPPQPQPTVLLLLTFHSNDNHPSIQPKQTEVEASKCNAKHLR